MIFSMHRGSSCACQLVVPVYLGPEAPAVISEIYPSKLVEGSLLRRAVGWNLHRVWMICQNWWVLVGSRSWCICFSSRAGDVDGEHSCTIWCMFCLELVLKGESPGEDRDSSSEPSSRYRCHDRLCRSVRRLRPRQDILFLQLS